MSTLRKRIASRLGRGNAGLGDGSAPMPYAINQNRQYLEAFRTALDRYYPKVYPGRITVFRTQRQPLVCSFDPHMCWDQWTSGGIDVKLIPGSNTTILNDPYAREFTQQLRAAMDRSEPDTAIM